MSQSKKGSLLEAFINVAIGYGVAVASQIVIFPLFRVHMISVLRIWHWWVFHSG